MAAHALMESLSQPKLAVDGDVIDGPLFRGLDEDSLAIAPMKIENRGDRPIEVGITVRGISTTPEPAGGNYYSITRSYYTLDGQEADLAHGGSRARNSSPCSASRRPRVRARGWCSTIRFRPASRSTIRTSSPSGDVAALDWLNPRR